MAYIPELHDAVERPEQVKVFLSEGRPKQVKDVIARLVDDEFERMEEYADNFIADIAGARAQRFLDRVIMGDEDAARALFGVQNNHDRIKDHGSDAGEPWAKVYHGQLFMTAGMEIRQKIVEAHADLLKNERILDLESVVEGLRKQIVEMQRQLDRR